MPPALRINAVAFVSASNAPILVRTFVDGGDDLKYHYLAHTSLDVIEERIAQPKFNECYLGLLFSMEDVAVYGFMTPLKLKIVVALALTDTVVRDADVVLIFKAFHTAYMRSISNPFLRVHASPESSALVDPSPALLTEANADARKVTAFKRRVDDVARSVLGHDNILE
ncbi:Sedlin [Exidia glandulosa HHB12029]|uniref:Trafficking protein particle complex subunit 2-like protein n=1 Tax=Exidia glandulosa HHB12029 TaxID=1314781 RepID=A0A165PZI2_EXIGL|nr:Sedlin [Exidia glandulosa HHB12029]